MHNLFLGTGKHMLGVRVETDILTKKSLLLLGKRMHSFIVPDGVGRLPTNIGSTFATSKYFELKNSWGATC